MDLQRFNCQYKVNETCDCNASMAIWLYRRCVFEVIEFEWKHISAANELTRGIPTQKLKELDEAFRRMVLDDGDHTRICAKVVSKFANRSEENSILVDFLAPDSYFTLCDVYGCDCRHRKSNVRISLVSVECYVNGAGAMAFFRLRCQVFSYSDCHSSFLCFTSCLLPLFHA